MKKSTHKGHCQACGRLHMLPGGTLAKHGYSVLHRGQGGYFSGTCRGSDHVPFEESCELTKKLITDAEDHVAHLYEAAKTFRNKATPDDVMVNHRMNYVGVIPVRAKLVAMEGTRFKYKLATATDDVVFTSKFGGYGTDLVKCAAILNDKHAESLEYEARQITVYVVNQKERVQGWKPAPLVPLKKGQ